MCRFVAGAALCERRGADFVAGAALCEPPCEDFVGGSGHEMRCFSIERVTPKLASQALQTDVCETVSGHARIMVGIVPPL